MQTIIGFAGNMHSGKSEAADYLRRVYGFEGSNITDPMDEALAPLMRRLGVPSDEIMSRLNGNKKNDPIPGFDWISGRKLKQAFGREFRDAISQPVENAENETDRGFFHDLWLRENKHHKRLVHASVRYPFEAELLRRDGAKVYRLVDPDDDQEYNHESENTTFETDGVIFNPKIGLENLHQALDKIMDDLGIAKIVKNKESEQEPQKYVMKFSFVFDVLGATENPVDFANEVKGMSLSEILEESDTGDFIAGIVTRSKPYILPPANVKMELLAMGNDGTFFDENF